MRSLFEAPEQGTGGHPRAEDLLLYVNGELPSRKAAVLRSHLEACWACRVKTEKIEATISAFMDYRSRMAQQLPALSTGVDFRNRLHVLAKQQQAKRTFRTLIPEMRHLLRPLRSRAWLLAGVAAVAVLAIATGLKYAWPPRVSAGELLASSSAAEAAKADDVSLVLHRSLVLEERRSSDKKVLQRRRIDVWHGGKRGVTARRVYDDTGRLLAGEWRQRDGVTRIYERGLRPRMETRATATLALPNTADELWRVDPSAHSFTEWIKNGDGARVKRQGAFYLVSFSPARPAAGLLEAVLTVRRADLRAVGLDLLIAAPQDSRSPAPSAQPAPELYSITEDGYEQEPTAAAKEQVFEPDPELVASEPTDSTNATADLQIEATYLLDQIGATLGQQISVTTGPDHKLHVAGVVETEERKNEILNALAPIHSNPAVTVKVLSYAEVLRRGRPGSPSTSADLAGVPAENATIPAEADLMEYLANQAAPGEQPDLRARVQQISEQVVNDSNEAMRHAWVLKRLADAIPPAQIHGLSETAHQEYLYMIHEHAQQVGQRTRNLRSQLEAAFFPGNTSVRPLTAPGNSVTREQAVDRLFEAVARNDKAIQSSFSVTLGRKQSMSIKSLQFQDSLIEVEELACWIQSTAGAGCDPGAPDGKAKP